MAGWSRAVLVVPVVYALACGALLGVDEFHAGGAGGGTSGGGGDATGPGGSDVSGSASSAGAGGDGGPCPAMHVCAPGVEGSGGYQGYFYLRQMPFSGQYVGPCAGYYDTPNMAQASCSKCTCGDLNNANCGQPILQLWNMNQCNDGFFFNDHTATCKIEVPTHSTSFAKVAPGSWNNDGSCIVSGKDNAPPPFEHTDEACPAPKYAGGCRAGQCIAPPPDSGHSLLCVLGKGSCPSEYQAQPAIDAWADYSDDRDCTCTCTPSSADCSGGSVDIYGCSPICVGYCQAQNGAPTHVSVGDCKDVTDFVAPENINSWSFKLAGGSTAANGKCTLAAGVPGVLTPKGPTTLCCRKVP